MNNEKSLETSRGNSNKLPSLLQHMKNREYKNILNYGCGLYGDKHKEMMEEYDIHLVNFDKYIVGINYISEINMKEIDCIVCSNVLNVIPNEEEIVDVINFFVKSGKDVYVSIYEGNRSNELILNSKGYWQRNETRKVFYNKFLARYGFIREGNFFILKGGKKNEYR